MSHQDPFELPHERAERLRPDPCPELWRDDAWCEHVNLVVPRFYVGDMRYRSSEHHEDDLRARGITHIVDCRTEHERAQDSLPEPTWCPTFLAPTDDDMQPKGVHYFDRIARWAAELDGGATLLVHCQSGVNRGPSALFAILRLHDPASTTRSVLASIRTARPIAAAVYWRDAEDAALEILGRRHDGSDS